jgi:hypothetical protein
MKQPVSFVYFSFGSPHLHYRTIFSILSLHLYYKCAEQDKILVFTDSPGFYQHLISELDIDCQLLNPEDVKQMMGSTNLIHRVKIGIIEKTTLLYPEHILFYVDSDTFFYKPFSEIFDKITPTQSVMHKLEYPMSQLGQYPTGDKEGFRKMYDILCNEIFKVGKEVIKIIPDKFDSWNAGIIGLHPAHFPWLKLVYQLTDQFYAPTCNHACEQYAFSYILQTRTQISDCENYNRHYWHRIEKQITDEMLNKLLNKQFVKMSLTEKKQQVDKKCRYLLMIFPKHPYTLRYKAMIAFSEKKYGEGYKNTLLTLLKNPFQPFSFFKDVAYYTRRMIIS